MGAAGATRAARSALHSNLARMAIRIRNRRGAGINRNFLSPLDSGEPRWLMIHGRNHQAEEIVADVERKTWRNDRDQRSQHSKLSPRAFALARIATTPKSGTRLFTSIGDVRFSASCSCQRRHFYNAIFFTYALVLMRFYGVPEKDVGGYLLPFALGNVLGPLLLGHLFDTIGRKQMITLTYALAGVLLAVTGWLFTPDC